MTALPAKSTFDGTASPTTSTMKTAMGNLRDYLAGLLGAEGTGINEARGSVAMHATTMDLWAQPNIIDGTGSAVTVTDIADAPQAGARRVLYPIAASIITNGATFAVDGAASHTAAAGDRWEFEAITVSTFKVHVIKKDGTAVVSQTAIAKNYITNGSFAVNQVVTPTTADNSYPIDEWRLLLGAANAATFVQDTADVPTGAGYAAKLIVGSGNNNKFGLWHPIENKDMLDLRGGVCSIRVPLKATAGLTDGTGKIRIGIMEWTGTADGISADPISAWNAEGSNPTPIASWGFANTPAAIAVTTSWADYLVENVSINASATNLAILIWSDDATNTQTTDILRIGGYITMSKSAAAPAAFVPDIESELRRCRRKYRKSYDQAVAAGTASSVGMVCTSSPGTITGAFVGGVQFDPPMRAAPTVTVYSHTTGSSGLIRDVDGAADLAATTGNIGDTGFSISAAFTADHRYTYHYTANARL